ncbi:MAG: phosphatase PAP2 family protein [Actinomycetota bacterium]
MSSDAAHDPRTIDRFGAVDALDDLVDGWWDQLRGQPAIDRLFYGASELGDHSLVWHLLGTAAAATTLRNERAAVRLIAALAVESGLVNGVVKSLFNRSRPIQDVPRPLRLRIPRTSSFPSGHASSASMAAVLLADKSRLGPVYGLLAALIATSRVHVRIHHASDVIGGAVVGTALGALVRRVAPLPG